MRIYKFIASVVLLTLLTIACNSDSEKSSKSEESTTQQQDNTNSGESEAHESEASKVDVVVYTKTLLLQNVNFDISSIKGENATILKILPSGLSIDNKQAIHEIDGTVINAEIEDLNSDGFPEVLVYISSDGSGSYGSIIGYSVNNGKSMSQISFPSVTYNNEANKGYMGHDEFAVVENTLVQRFPIYKENDTNAKPTGKTRQIQYKLKEGEASRQFVVDKILEY